MYIWDGVTDFDPPHRKLFDFNRHVWVYDYLELVGQPLLCFGIEWHGSRRRGGWEAEYHLAYERDDGIFFRLRTDLASLRRELAPYLRGIQVERLVLAHRVVEFVIDQPPAYWSKVRPYYRRSDKRLHFESEEKLKRFIAYMWGREKVALLGKVARPKPVERTATPKEGRLKGFIEGI